MKYTAIFHTYDIDGYDGTRTYAKLMEIVNPDGAVLSHHHPIWAAAKVELDHDDRIMLGSDNPGDCGTTIEILGRRLDVGDFHTGESGYDEDGDESDEFEVFKLDFEVEVRKTDAGPPYTYVIVPSRELLVETAIQRAVVAGLWASDARLIADIGGKELGFKIRPDGTITMVVTEGSGDEETETTYTLAVKVEVTGVAGN